MTATIARPRVRVHPITGSNPARQSLLAHDAVRAFRLTARPSRGDAFGITLDETYIAAGTLWSSPVLDASAAQVARVLDAVIATVRQSGYTPGSLTVRRGSPLPIHEPAGVRLALTLFTTAPVTRHDRVRAIVAGINAMSVEETYYWYGKCVGHMAARARKALRVLLADNKPAGD